MNIGEKSMLLDGLDEAFHKKSWHGPNLRGAIRGVTAAQAAWRPTGDRHNIWELTLHAAYWKYVVRRKILRDKRGSFVLAGSNFFERPEGGSPASEAEWKRDIAILEAEHWKLRDTVADLPGSRVYSRGVPFDPRRGCTRFVSRGTNSPVAAHVFSNTQDGARCMANDGIKV